LVPSSDTYVVQYESGYTELLTEHGGNVAAIARAMRTARMQIHRFARRFGIDFEAYRRVPDDAD
jgi:transcriptional regulator with GAF, ATPase, and Fis domain